MTFCYQQEIQEMNHYTYFLKSNQGQASALKVAYIFKASGAESFLMVA